MICPSCKSALEDGLRYCLHCGRYLGEADQATLNLRPLPPTIASRAPDLTPEWPRPTLQQSSTVRAKGIFYKVAAILIILAVLITLITYFGPSLMDLMEELTHYLKKHA